MAHLVAAQVPVAWRARVWRPSEDAQHEEPVRNPGGRATRNLAICCAVVGDGRAGPMPLPKIVSV